MAALFSSWWSGKSAEGEEGEKEKSEEGGEEKKEVSEKKDSSWMTGLEGNDLCNCIV